VTRERKGGRKEPPQPVIPRINVKKETEDKYKTYPVVGPRRDQVSKRFGKKEGTHG